jgi:fumarate reductase subunit D
MPVALCPLPVLSFFHMSEPMQGTVVPKFDPKDVEDHKVMAALSYIGFLCLVPLLTMRKSRFAQEHAKQGLLLFVVWIVGSFIFWIPFVGWAALMVVFIVDVIAFAKCLMGEFWEIPVIGRYRSKINL